MSIEGKIQDKLLQMLEKEIDLNKDAFFKFVENTIIKTLQKVR